MSWRCFWVEETGDCERSLRIFTFGQYHGGQPGDGYTDSDDRPSHAACPALPERPVKDKPGMTYQSGHDATVDIGTAPLVRDAEGFIDALDLSEYDGDPRWPATCRHCGGPFPDGAVRQVNQEPILAEVHVAEGATARAWQQRGLPPGAMFDGSWHRQKGDDGIALVVVLPPESPDMRAHFWHVDGPASNQRELNARGWKRTGDPKANPPTVTATPSILTGDYHGFLTEGRLTDPI